MVDSHTAYGDPWKVLGFGVGAVTPWTRHPSHVGAARGSLFGWSTWPGPVRVLSAWTLLTRAIGPPSVWWLTATSPGVGEINGMVNGLGQAARTCSPGLCLCALGLAHSTDCVHLDHLTRAMKQTGQLAFTTLLVASCQEVRPKISRVQPNSKCLPPPLEYCQIPRGC